MDSFARYLPALESEMRRAVASGTVSPELLYGMIRYHMGWVDAEFLPTQIGRGKQLRPVLLLLSCETVGGDWRKAIPAAAAVEFFHNFSLVHDDIEDHDPMRRERPTLWTLWGEAQAINAGDALFALSYRALARLRETGLDAEQVLAIQDRFNETVIQLTEGQCMDIRFETQGTVTESDYLQMVGGKTAALIGLACEMGSMAAAAQLTQVKAFQEFGYNLGMSFQMQDDLLGMWGDPAQVGKPVGSDLQKHKKTLPILHGLTHSEPFRALFARTELDEADIAQAQGMLEEAGSRAYTEARVNEYHQRALSALGRIDAAVREAKEALVDLTQRLLNRKK